MYKVVIDVQFPHNHYTRLLPGCTTVAISWQPQYHHAVRK